jgi:hypothetical protein
MSLCNGELPIVQDDVKSLIINNGVTHYLLDQMMPVYDVIEDTLYVLFPTPDKNGKRIVATMPPSIRSKLLANRNINKLHIDLRGCIGGSPFIFIEALLSNICVDKEDRDVDAVLLYGASKTETIPILSIDKRKLIVEYEGYREEHKLTNPIVWCGSPANKIQRPLEMTVEISYLSQSSAQMMAILLKNHGATIIGDAPADLTNVPVCTDNGIRIPQYRFADKDGTVYRGMDKFQSVNECMVEMPEDIEILKSSVICQDVDNPIRLPIVSKWHQFVQERYNISQPSSTHIVGDFILKRQKPAFKDGVLHIINPSGYVSAGSMQSTSTFIKRATIIQAYEPVWKEMETWRESNPDKTIYLDARGYQEYGDGMLFTFYPFLDMKHTMDSHKFNLKGDVRDTPLTDANYVLVVDELFGKYHDLTVMMVLDYFHKKHKIDGRLRHRFEYVLKEDKIGKAGVKALVPWFKVTSPVAINASI